MATTHLISGLPCSGKTTYAAGLRADLNGVLFSLDRWLITAFGQYAIAVSATKNMSGACSPAVS